MILERLEMAPQDFERQTGWTIGPEGACKEEVCIPLPRAGGPTLDVRLMAERLGLPLLHEEVHGVWCLGLDSGGKMLATAAAPELRLPDWRGPMFTLSSLRGMKVLLIAWASW